MKKLLGLICMILLISCEKPKQDSVVLTIQYQPETTYNYSAEQTMETVITYSGKQKSLEELKRRGHQNPTLLNKQSSTVAMIKTGKPEDDDTRFPVKVDYASVITVNGIKEAPVNAIFHGKCLMDSIPVFDVAVANEMDRQSKMHLLESWQKSFCPLSFSGQMLKIGEVITTRNLLSFPMEGSEIEMIVVSHYQLIAIKDHVASLELTQDYTLNPKLMDNSFQGSVKGQGHLEYDLEHRVVTNYSLNTDMELTKKLDSFEFHLKTKSQLVQEISIVTKEN